MLKTFKRHRILWALPGAALLALVLLTWRESSKQDESVLAPIRLCMSRNISNALVVLADRHELFRAEGVSLQIELADLGRTCAQRLREGKVDLAIAYNTPVVRQLLQGEAWTVLTELHSSNHNTQLLFPRAGGIRRPLDLEHKRVGMIAGTNGEYLLILFAKAHQLNLDRIKKVYLESDQMGAALTKGAVDAIVAWEPIISQIETSHPPQSYASFESNFYTEYSLLVAPSEWVRTHSETSTQILRALARSQRELEMDPAAARVEMQQWAHLSPEVLNETVWNKVIFGLGLSRTLKTMMEQEANILGDRSESKDGYDFSPAFEPPILLTVAPEKVTFR